MDPIVILDTETTGRDPKQDILLEVAYAVWHPVDGFIRASSETFSFKEDDPRVLASTAIHGISPTMGRWGWPFTKPITFHFSSAPPVVVAHNAAFDRQFYPIHGAVWVCSMEDIEWPRKATSRSLTALALAHGVGVTMAHRAIADVMTLVQVFDRAKELGWDAAREIERAQRPKCKVFALVSYDDRELAKMAGFQWDPNTRRWSKNMFVDQVKDLPFETTVA